MEINNRKQAVGGGRVVEEESSDMALGSVKNLIINFTSNPQPIMQPNNGRSFSPFPDF